MRAAFLLIGCLAAAAQADTLDLHLLSVHDRPGFNNRNWGIGWRREDGLGVGVYRNSYGRTSAYAGWTWETDSRPLSLAVSMGAVTGYPAARVMPFVVPSVAWHITPRTEVRLALTPKPPVRGSAACVHLMIGVKI